MDDASGARAGCPSVPKVLRRHLAPLAGLALLLPLAGCSADETTPAVPSNTSVSTPTMTTSAPVTPSPTTPTPVATVSLPAPTFRPEGTFNEDDAIGFAAYYLQVLNYARATGDPALLRSISEPDCQTCETLAASVDEHRKLGYTSINRDVGFESAELLFSDPVKQEADVNLTLVTKDSKLVGPDGSTINENPGSVTDGLVQMHLRDGHWYIQELPVQ